MYIQGQKFVFVCCFGSSDLQESKEKVEKNIILMKTRLSRRMVSKTLTFSCPLHLGDMLQCVAGSHELLPHVRLPGARCHVPAVQNILMIHSTRESGAERWRLLLRHDEFTLRRAR